MELTTGGERFLPYACDLLSASDSALAAMRSGSEAPVRLDVVDNRLSPTFVLRHLAEAALDLQVERSGRGGLGPGIDAVLRDEVDVAFGRVCDLERAVPPEVEHRLVRLEPLHALLPPEHPLADGDVVRLADLREEGLWLPSVVGPPEFRRFLERLGAEFGVPLDFTGTSYGLRHTLEQARYGRQRVTLVGADMDLPHDLTLRILPFEPAPLFPWSVVWRRGTERPALRGLLALAGRVSRAEGWCVHDPEHSWIPHVDGISPAARSATH